MSVRRIRAASKRRCDLRVELVEEAVLVFAETGQIWREPGLAAIRQENADSRRWAEVQFDEVLTLRLTPDAALLTYRATARWAHASSPIAVFASSVYVRRGGRWKLAFHQQTPA